MLTAKPITINRNKTEEELDAIAVKMEKTVSMPDINKNEAFIDDNSYESEDDEE